MSLENGCGDLLEVISDKRRSDLLPIVVGRTAAADQINIRHQFQGETLPTFVLGRSLFHAALQDADRRLGVTGIRHRSQYSLQHSGGRVTPVGVRDLSHDCATDRLTTQYPSHHDSELFSHTTTPDYFEYEANRLRLSLELRCDPLLVPPVTKNLASRSDVPAHNAQVRPAAGKRGQRVGEVPVRVCLAQGHTEFPCCRRIAGSQPGPITREHAGSAEKFRCERREVWRALPLPWSRPHVLLQSRP